MRFDNTMDGAPDLVKLAKSVNPDVKAVLEPSANYWLKVYDRLEDEGVSASFVGTGLCCTVNFYCPNRLTMILISLQISQYLVGP